MLSIFVPRFETNWGEPITKFLDGLYAFEHVDSEEIDLKMK